MRPLRARHVAECMAVGLGIGLVAGLTIQPFWLALVVALPVVWVSAGRLARHRLGITPARRATVWPWRPR